AWCLRRTRSGSRRRFRTRAWKSFTAPRTTSSGKRASRRRGWLRHFSRTPFLHLGEDLIGTSDARNVSRQHIVQPAVDIRAVQLTAGHEKHDTQVIPVPPSVVDDLQTNRSFAKRIGICWPP